jgi:hypothetical protein
VSQNVLKRLIDACERLVSPTPQPLSGAFRTFQSTLGACQKINAGFIDKTSTLQHLQELDPCHILIFHVVEQNAAMLMLSDPWASVAEMRTLPMPFSF